MSRPSSIHRAALAGAGLASLALLQACVATSPRFDERFGSATHDLLVQQRHDPDATRRNGQEQPPTDGRSVRATRDHAANGSTSGATTRGAGALMTGGGSDQ